MNALGMLVDPTITPDGTPHGEWHNRGCAWDKCRRLSGLGLDRKEEHVHEQDGHEGFRDLLQSWWKQVWRIQLPSLPL